MQNLSEDEFKDYMYILANYCAVGTDDIPEDLDKSAYWRNAAELQT